MSNASFVVADISALMAVDEFDAITVFDAIHDQANPGQVLANIYRALRPGGELLVIDIKASSNLEDNIGQPFAPLLYTTSTMHCMSVSLGMNGAGLFSVRTDISPCLHSERASRRRRRALQNGDCVLVMELIGPATPCDCNWLGVTSTAFSTITARIVDGN